MEVANATVAVCLPEAGSNTAPLRLLREVTLSPLMKCGMEIVIAASRGIMLRNSVRNALVAIYAHSRLQSLHALRDDGSGESRTRIRDVRKVGHATAPVRATMIRRGPMRRAMIFAFRTTAPRRSSQNSQNQEW